MQIDERMLRGIIEDIVKKYSNTSTNNLVETNIKTTSNDEEKNRDADLNEKGTAERGTRKDEVVIGVAAALENIK